MAKRLIVCSDGTWNTPDQMDDGEIRPSNVVKMARALAPQAPDGRAQVVYYDRGVGTGFGLDRLTGGAFGRGLSENVEDAYRFLVDNYVEGDEIYFFGFSRGAFTVRSTGGLIRNCGLLKKIHAHKFPEAYALYRSKAPADEPDGANAVKFREDYAFVVRVKFMGVWDTVGALGIPFGLLRLLTKHRYEFHDVRLSRYVDNAYQALAVDERRKTFRPAIWETKKIEGQNVEQVWFAGVHSNIGGGYKDSGLSDIAFLWMQQKAAACGLAFDQEYINAVIHPDSRGGLRKSKTGLFRLLGDFIRPIGKGTNSEEAVHQTAIERRETDPEYRPENLIAYLESGAARITGA